MIIILKNNKQVTSVFCYFYVTLKYRSISFVLFLSLKLLGIYFVWFDNKMLCENLYFHIYDIKACFASVYTDDNSTKQ